VRTPGIVARWRWCIAQLLPSNESARCTTSPEQVLARICESVDHSKSSQRIRQYAGLSAGSDHVFGWVGEEGRFRVGCRLADEVPLADLARPHLRGTVSVDEPGSTVDYRLSSWGGWVVGFLGGVIGLLSLVLAAALAVTGTDYVSDGHAHSLAIPFLWVGLALLGIGLFVFLNTAPETFRQGSYLTDWLSNTVADSSQK
jgi:hypothetical protein